MISHSTQGKDIYLNQAQLRRMNKGMDLEGGFLPFLPMLLPFLGPVLKAITGGGCQDCEMEERMKMLEASGFFSDFGQKIKKFLGQVGTKAKKVAKQVGNEGVDFLTKNARDLTPKALDFLEKEARALADRGISSVNKETRSLADRAINAAERKARSLLEKLGSGVSPDIKERVIMALLEEGLPSSKITAAKLKKLLSSAAKPVKSTDKRKTRGILIKKLMKENKGMTLPEASAFIKDNNLKY